MSFEVRLHVLETVGDEVAFFGESMGMARLQAERLAEATGGELFGHLQDVVTRSRADLVEAYARGSHYPRYFARAGNALKACAEDYRTVDYAARARLDALLTDAEPLPDTEQLHGDAEDHGLTTSELYARTDTDQGINDWTQWRQVREFLDYGASVSAWVQLSGVPSTPIDDLLALFDGPWEVFDESLNAFVRLELFWSAVREELADSVAYLDTGWSGLAASSVFHWFDQFDGVLRDHELGLQERKHRMASYHDGLMLCIEAIRPYVDLMAVVVEEVADEILDAADAAVRIAGLVGIALAIVDGLILTVGLGNLAFSLLPVRDLAVPDDTLSVLTAPDVDGP